VSVRDDTALVEIGMPRLSDSMEEATVLQWLKRPGEHVEKGEPLVEVETDKATVVYEAELGGVVEEILVEDGATAALGAPIALLRPDEAAPRPAAQPAPAAVAPAAAVAPPEPERPRRREGRARATPVARRLADELGVPLEGLAGSGPGGRIVRADVRAAAAPSPAAAAPQQAAAAAQPDAAAPADEGRGAVTVVELGTTQRTIARRMSESRSEIPEFTVEAEIDMEAAAALRAGLAETGREPLPSYNDLVVKAVALALRDFPGLNATFEGGKVLRYERVNVGIAVATDDALLVPTILDADRRSVFEVAAESRRLAARVRDRTIGAAELASGTFTVSNLGMFGVRRFNAIVNHPQVAILAVGELAPRAVVAADGALVARRRMDVALSCDHRAVYGAEAGRFLQRLRTLLERPIQLVLDDAHA
jgi:pyruvate dehydrogenase E2 component (dihydrolipoamide acetyltransferase)